VRVITTAGKALPSAPAPDRKSIIAELRRTIRDPRAPESAVDDALEAIIELARLED